MPNIVSNAELLVAMLKTSSITQAHQAVITLFHSLAEDAIKQHLTYDPTYQDHVEVYPVQSFRQASTRLQLKHLPVRRVSEVIIDTAAYGGQAANAFTSTNGAETLTAGEDYFVKFTNLPANIGGTNGLSTSDGFCKNGILQATNWNWPCQPGSIKVTYTAGYTEQELNGHGAYHTAGQIKKATLDMLMSNFKELVTQANAINSGKAGNVSSERFGDYSYTLDSMSTVLTSFAMVVPASTHAQLQGHKNFGVLGL